MYLIFKIRYLFISVGTELSHVMYDFRKKTEDQNYVLNVKITPSNTKYFSAIYIMRFMFMYYL